MKEPFGTIKTTFTLSSTFLFAVALLSSLPHRSTSASFLPTRSSSGISSSSRRSFLAFQNSNPNKHHNYTTKKSNNSEGNERISSTVLEAQRRESSQFGPNFSHNYSPYGQNAYMNNRQGSTQQQQYQQQYQEQYQQQQYSSSQQSPLQQPSYPPTPHFVTSGSSSNSNSSNDSYTNYNDSYTNNSNDNTVNHYRTSPNPPQSTQYTNGSNGSFPSSKNTFNNNHNNNYNSNVNGGVIQHLERNTNTNTNYRTMSTAMNTNNNINNNNLKAKLNINTKTYQHDHIGDAAAYNQYVSKAVDIDSVTERNGILTVIRSCRDIDNNTRRKFISYYNLVSLATAESSEDRLSSEGGNNNNDAARLPPSSGGYGMSKLVQSLEEAQEDTFSSTMATSILSSGAKVATMLMPPVEMSPAIKARVISPSGNKIAVFMQEKDGGKTKQIVEIWTAGGVSLVKRIVLPYDKLHGDICFDKEWFGSISWNHDETALVYAAEMKAPSTKSYFHLEDDKSVLPGMGANGSTSSSSSKSFIGATNELGYGKGEDWGEKYATTCRLNLYILNIMTNKVGAVKNVPGGKRKNDFYNPDANTSASTEAGYTLGQPIFSPCGNYIVYTGWDAGGGGDMSRRLGSIYCYQRPSKIYASSVRQLLVELANPPSSSSYNLHGDYASFIDAEVVEDDYECVTPNDRLARSPRFSKASFSGMKKLVYLCNTEGFDTHGGAMALYTVDWNNAQGVQLHTTSKLVDVVELPTFTRDEMDDEKKVLGMSFPGLFMNQLPENCFSRDGRFILATTQWGSITKIIRIHVETGEVKAIDFNLTDKYTVINDASQNLLCLTSSGDAIVSQSSPSKPALIGIIKASYLTDNDVKVKPTIQLPPLPSVTATSKFTSNQMENTGDMACHLVSITPGHGDVKSVVQGILLLPLNENGEEEKKVPLIVVPHGGPHSCTQATFMPSYAYLCEYGKYAVLHVNYRGSIGFGQLPIQDLPGNIGRQDVDDVVQLTERVLYSFTAIDASRVGICGGSHGGFLAGHAVGQYPEIFKVAAMRNPVTNIATMVSSTDIPDWCYVEALGNGKYDWESFRGPNPDELNKMWESSPIAHVNQVRAPILIAIGKSDKRVPPSQGMEYYHTLRSMGVTTKLLTYDEDDHAIDKVQSEADHWINIKQWFDEHI